MCPRPRALDRLGSRGPPTPGRLHLPSESKENRGSLPAHSTRECEFSLAAAEAAGKPVQPERTGLIGPRAPRDWGPEPRNGLFPNHTTWKWQSQDERSALSSACLCHELLPRIGLAGNRVRHSLIHVVILSFTPSINISKGPLRARP